MEFLNILKSKIFKNAGWLVFSKVGRMIFAFFIDLAVARFLGPDKFGLISYAGAYTIFFTALCNLGTNTTLVKDFFDYPDETNITLGSAIGMRIVSSLGSVIIIFWISSIMDYGDQQTITVVVLYSMSLIWQSFDSFDRWFQYKLQSKFSAIASLIGYTATAVYSVVLLMQKKDVAWFAASKSVNWMIVAAMLYWLYRKEGGSQLSFSPKRAIAILRRSRHFIISGLMIAIYGQTDKMMLKAMISEQAVGYYATAVSICTAWCFVLAAIIESCVPSIMESTNNEAIFRHKNIYLYAFVFYLSVFVSLMLTVFARPIVRLLYGAEFMPSVEPLKIVTWYTAFSYLGVAREAWIVSKNRQRYLLPVYASAAITNVILNLLLIPRFGASGAAVASLIAQITTTLIVPFAIRDLRENAFLMLDAILLKGVFSKRHK